MRSALLETSAGNIIFLSIENIKAGFQHADFSASADFYACADFSAYPHMNFHHNADF